MMGRNRIGLRGALVGIGLLAGAPGAQAHGFTTFLLLPPGTAASVAADMREAFLLAARERDGHPQETSDGHLGGLDMTLMQGGADEAGTASADIVAAPLALPDPGLLAAIADRMGAAALPPSGPTEGAAGLPSPLDPALAPFEERFREATDRAPGPEAAAAYLAARRIDLAVRRLGGVGDRAALEAALAP